MGDDPTGGLFDAPRGAPGESVERWGGGIDKVGSSVERWRGPTIRRNKREPKRTTSVIGTILLVVVVIVAVYVVGIYLGFWAGLGDILAGRVDA